MNESRVADSAKTPLLSVFFGGTLFAWVIWFLQIGKRFGYLQWAPSLQSPLNALTVWSPGLAAIFLTLREKGKPGVASLFRGLSIWRVPLRWYAAALIMEPAKWVLALSADRMMSLEYELGPALLVRTFSAATAFMVPVAVLFSLPNALGEELGWRAFALPRLQSRFGPLGASVFLGLFWGLWHVPAYFAWPSSNLSFLGLLIMAINMVPSAVLFTWIYNRTGGSLLLVCLYHASITNKNYFMPRLPSFTEAVILWAIALIVICAGGLAVRKGTDATEEQDVGIKVES